MYPEIIADMHRIRYWAGYRRDFESQKSKFKIKYKCEFDSALGSVSVNIPKKIKGENKLDILSKFLETNDIGYNEKMKIINKSLAKNKP